MHNQKGSLHLVIIGVLTIILIAVLGMIFWQHFGSKLANNSQAQTTASPSVSTAVKPDEPTDLTANTRGDKANIWAGFVVDSATFTAVEGRVKVPTVTCTKTEQTFGAWVGFDGWGGSQTVEQVGIDATCEDASAFLKTPAIGGVYYYAWAAMHGAGNYENFDIVIKPGDTIYSKASYADGKFTLYVKNETTGQSGTNIQACKVPDGFHEATGDCPRSHAEWIVERPGSNQLPNFDKVTLYDNKVTTEGGKTGYIEWFPNTLVDMFQGGIHLANTSGLRERGTFDVSWLATGKTGD